MNAAPSVEFDTSGIEKMIGMLNKMNKSPQKAVNAAVSKARTIVKRRIKYGTVPVGETGYLKKSITNKKEERPNRRGRRVNQTIFDPAYNSVLQKPIKNPGSAGGSQPYAYYPASQEYGYLTRSKGGGLDYVPGLHFMREGAEAAYPEAMQTMITTMEKELDKIWQKAQHA